MWTRSRIFESVKTNSVVEWVAWALGVIILGALGSGLWEIALKPALVRASYGLMSLSSLGIESVRTGIYERIATGSTSRAGVQTLLLITLLTVSIAVSIFYSFLLVHVELQRRQKRRDGRADAVQQSYERRLRENTSMIQSEPNDCGHGKAECEDSFDGSVT
jgi:hypothetical protein